MHAKAVHTSNDKKKYNKNWHTNIDQYLTLNNEYKNKNSNNNNNNVYRNTKKEYDLSQVIKEGHHTFYDYWEESLGIPTYITYTDMHFFLMRKYFLARVNINDCTLIIINIKRTTIGIHKN